MNKDKTLKKKQNNIDKSKLWNIFDVEIKNPDKVDVPLECVYGSSDREFCERCGYGLAFSEEGFLTCTNNNCCIVYKDLIDQTAEWRYYGADDNNNTDPTRCGMPINPLLVESSYGCKVIGGGHMTYEMRKIKRYSEWQMTLHKEKTLHNEFQIITTMSQNAGIPKRIIDDAIVYHKKISESESTFRGDNRDGIIAGSIYISCKKNNYPRTPKEIAQIFHLDYATASKGCKNAWAIINNLEKDMDNDDKTNFNKTTPLLFIDRYCSKLNINKELTKLCQFISIKIEKMNAMPENTPPSIAAGIIYLIVHLCNLIITKKEIKNVSEISEVTINKCYKKLETIVHEQQIIPTAIIKKYKL